MFAYVKCRCGRTLRAQRSPDRTTIRCWDCHAEVAVPRFRSLEGPKRSHRLRGAMNSARAESVAAIVLLALALTAAISLPRVGGLVALAMLVYTALGYIRRVEAAGRALESEEDAEADDRAERRPGRRLGRLAMALTLVVGLAAVPWLAEGSRQLEYVRPIVPPPTLPIVGVLLWLALPAWVFLRAARDESGPLGARRALIAARRRPAATALALLTPLLAISAVEAALVGALLWSDNFGTFVLDLFPPQAGDEIRTGVYVASEDGINFGRPEKALGVYADGLGRGAALLGSVPASFRRGLQPRLLISAYGDLRSEGYLVARIGVASLAFLTAFAALAVQSSWLGRIGLAAPPPDDEDEDAVPGPAPADGEARPGPAPIPARAVEPEPAGSAAPTGLRAG